MYICLGADRVVTGEGKVDFSANNANELVNPCAEFWRWKTVEEHVRGLLA